MNWLISWLEPQDDQMEATPSSAAPRVDWLSLLPAVTAFESPLVHEARGDFSGQVALDVPLEVTASELSTESPMPAMDDEKKDSSSLADADLADDGPMAPAPGEIGLQQSVTAIHIPVATDLPRPFGTVSLVPNQDSPLSDGMLAPRPPLGIPAADSATARQAVETGDKGEVIWSAEFAVQGQKSAGTDMAGQTPTPPSQKDILPNSFRHSVPETASESVIAGARTQQLEDSPQKEMGRDDSESNARNHEFKKHSNEPTSERASGKSADDSKGDSSLSNSELSESKVVAGVSLTASFPTEFKNRSATATRLGETGTVESVETTLAAPLKATQIAALQVDVPAPPGSDDVTPMRLVVSQRGDQVNVRLRSFDSAAGPIDDTRMQPLLNSLAEKGFVAELKPGARLDQTMPLAVERAQEKPLVMTESQGSQNDAQSFQNTNDRQQQNQERQQQLQAFYLRKQMKNVQSEAFALPAATPTKKVTYPHGGLR